MRKKSYMLFRLPPRLIEKNDKLFKFTYYDNLEYLKKIIYKMRTETNSITKFKVFGSFNSIEAELFYIWKINEYDAYTNKSIWLSHVEMFFPFGNFKSNGLYISSMTSCGNVATNIIELEYMGKNKTLYDVTLSISGIPSIM